MNRYERRKARKTRSIALDQIEGQFDIQVDAKVGRVVMICANAIGRKTVEELWPDVEWATDRKFASSYSSDWLFTHIRVTKIQAHLEGTVPLAFASADSLGFAVALALQAGTRPGRVAYWTGQDHDMMLNCFAAASEDRSAARSLYAEHVPAGTPVSSYATETVQ